jgi:serine/threonine protein kinase
MQVAEAKYEFFEAEWKGVSEDAKDLVRKLLVVDPNVRLNMAQVLEHKFLKDAVAAVRKAMIAKDKKPATAGATSAKGEVENRTGATKAPMKETDGPSVIELEKKGSGGCCIIA